MNSFSFAATPQLHFGRGKISILPSLIKSFGSKILLVTGARSFDSSYGPKLIDQLKSAEIEIRRCTIDKEPTPSMIDSVVSEFCTYKHDVVVSIGGGSVLDAGKAIAAMLPLNLPVKDYLEGVGTKTHPGVKIPFIAVPTTSGTGSEATKNAVLSETGERGYKKSLRHNNFVPNAAIIDPKLTLSCSPSTTASSGMDAFTQLLESYLSTTANPITDALAYEGLQRISKSLMKTFMDGNNLAARTDMALAAYLSGITLANAGLGLVHGFASSIGGYFEISHGVICSRLMGSVNKVTIRKLRNEKTNHQALTKYATIGKLFTDANAKSESYYSDLLLDTIDTLTRDMEIPSLSNYGITENDFDKIVSATDNKSNPVNLTGEEMKEVLFLVL